MGMIIFLMRIGNGLARCFIQGALLAEFSHDATASNENLELGAVQGDHAFSNGGPNKNHTKGNLAIKWLSER
jgi:hypothetical protein